MVSQAFLKRGISDPSGMGFNLFSRFSMFSDIIQERGTRLPVLASQRICSISLGDDFAAEN